MPRLLGPLTPWAFTTRCSTAAPPWLNPICTFFPSMPTVTWASQSSRASRQRFCNHTWLRVRQMVDSEKMTLFGSTFPTRKMCAKMCVVAPSSTPNLSKIGRTSSSHDPLMNSKKNEDPRMFALFSFIGSSKSGSSLRSTRPGGSSSSLRSRSADETFWSNACAKV